jgi:hypothetical protein
MGCGLGEIIARLANVDNENVCGHHISHWMYCHVFSSFPTSTLGSFLVLKSVLFFRLVLTASTDTVFFHAGIAIEIPGGCLWFCRQLCLWWSVFAIIEY